MSKSNFLFYLFNGLPLSSPMTRQSDHILGSIYAENGEIVKGSQAFRQHTIIKLLSPGLIKQLQKYFAEEIKNATTTTKKTFKKLFYLLIVTQSYQHVTKLCFAPFCQLVSLIVAMEI